MDDNDIEKENSREKVTEVGKQIGNKALQAHGVPPGLSNLAVNKLAKNPLIKGAMDRVADNPIIKKRANNNPSKADDSTNKPESEEKEGNEETNEKKDGESNDSPFVDSSKKDNPFKGKEDAEESIVSKKNVKKLKLYYIIGSAAAAILFIILILGMLLKIVEPIAEIVGAVVDFTHNVVKVANSFFESAKNLFKYGSFASNEQTLMNKIIEANNKFSKKYQKKINIPLVSAALYYDGAQDEWEETVEIVVNKDGTTTKVARLDNEKLDERVNYIDAIFDSLISIKEYTYRCDFRKNADGELVLSSSFISSKYVEEIDRTKEETSCSDLSAGENLSEEDRYIYYYREQYDEDGFAFRLANTKLDFGNNGLRYPAYVILNPIVGFIDGVYSYVKNLNRIYEKIDKYPGFAEKVRKNEVTIIDLLYTDYVEKAGDVDYVVIDIMNSYEVWKFLFGVEDGDDERCYFPGNVPPDILIELRSPFNGYYAITSRYGNRPNPVGDSDKKYEFHSGIDLVAKEDTNIYSIYDGVVSESGFSEGAGNYVIIEHNLGGTTYYSQYLHMQSPSSYTVGSSVSKSTVIGVMGSTGRSTGAHLHFGLYSINESGGRSYANPENLFTDAGNYSYNCISSKTNPAGSCSLNGGVAVYAFKERLSFDLIRAVIDNEKSFFGDFALMKLDYDLNYFKDIYESKKGSFSEINGKIDFEKYQVDSDGTMIYFEDATKNLIGRQKLLEYIGKMDKKVYDRLSFGFTSIPSSSYSMFGYKSSKEMYDIIYSNNFEFVQTIFNYAIHNNPHIEEIMNTMEGFEGPLYSVKGGETLESVAAAFGVSPSKLLREGESQGSVHGGNRIKLSDEAAISAILKALYSNIPADDLNNKFYNEHNFVANALAKYKEIKDDPDSSIEKYEGECLIVPIPGWEDCTTYESESKCKSNLKKYMPTARFFADTAPTTAGKRALTYAMSLLGKVRYCGACGIGEPECIDIKPDGTIGEHAMKYSYAAIRCSPWGHAYYKEGFNPKWGTLHTYTYNGTPYYENEAAEARNDISYQDDAGTYTAGLAGLDCAGFVNWVLNHTFQVFDNQTFPIMTTVCNSETDYTLSTQFESVPEFKNFGDSILPLLTPGDILCNSTGGKYGDAYNYSGNSRHVMMFMGYEDDNYNGVPDAGDSVIIIHSSSNGVRVDRKLANEKYWKELNSFATYK